MVPPGFWVFVLGAISWHFLPWSLIMFLLILAWPYPRR